MPPHHADPALSHGEAAIAEVIGRRTAGWPDRPVERAIFGSDDAVHIASAVGAFCLLHWSRPVSVCRFYESSIGCVFGLVLEGGREVVVKAHAPGRQPAELEATHRLQHLFARTGIPAPRPILPPSALGLSLASAEEMLDRGEYRDAHDEAVRHAMAGLLARMAAVGDGADVTGLPSMGMGQHPDGHLWGRPHSTLFDFEATGAGAEWIDELATQAQRLLREPAGDRVVGHADWAVKHQRFHGDSVVAVYDWDSLVFDAEPLIVGAAAHGFTMTWELPVAVAPSLAEARAFVADYETARGHPFNDAERRVLGAALTYSMGYTARCEHALDPGAGSFPEGSYRAALAAGRERWLDV